MAANRLLNAIYAVQKVAWRVLRPRTQGVKVMLFDESGALLLVRHSYGRSDLLVLPGGGKRPFEEPARAAMREVREELGLAVADLTLRSLHFSAAEGKRDRIHLFEGRVSADPILHGAELHEAQFVILDDLPSDVSQATRRRIEEYCGSRVADGSW
jgi:8-oxo-dGTP pyrophosphatase MutT (NUDIX family)